MSSESRAYEDWQLWDAFGWTAAQIAELPEYVRRFILERLL